MALVNENYLKLPGSYLFAEIARRVNKFKEEHPDCRLVVVSLDEKARMLNGVEIWPVAKFLEKLWNNQIIN